MDDLIARLEHLGKEGRTAGVVTIWGQAADRIRQLEAEVSEQARHNTDPRVTAALDAAQACIDNPCPETRAAADAAADAADAAYAAAYVARTLAKQDDANG